MLGEPRVYTLRLDREHATTWFGEGTSLPYQVDDLRWGRTRAARGLGTNGARDHRHDGVYSDAADGIGAGDDTSVHGRVCIDRNGSCGGDIMAAVVNTSTTIINY